MNKRHQMTLYFERKLQLSFTHTTISNSGKNGRLWHLGGMAPLAS